MTGTVDGRIVFASLWAHTDRPGGDAVGFPTMPDVPPPDACPSMSEPFAAALAGSFFDHLERRVAAGKFAVEAIDDPQAGPLGPWCRIPGHEIGTGASRQRPTVARHHPTVSVPSMPASK